MTDTINDEARELAEKISVSSAELLATKPRIRPWEDVAQDIDDASVVLIQSALTAARLKGREEAAKCVEDFDHPECEGGSRFAEAIRAMKVRP